MAIFNYFIYVSPRTTVLYSTPSVNLTDVVTLGEASRPTQPFIL